MATGNLRSEAMTSLSLFFWSIFTMLVNLSSFPFTYPKFRLSFSHLHSLFPFLQFLLFSISSSSSTTFISHSPPSLFRSPSVPPFFASHFPLLYLLPSQPPPLLPQFPCKKDSAWSSSFNSVPQEKRDSQCIKLRKPIPVITTTAVRSDLRSGHLIFVDSAPPPSFPSWIIVLKLSLTTNHEVQ